MTRGWTGSAEGGTGPGQAEILGPYLANSTGKHVDDLLMRSGHDTLPIDLNDSVSHTDAPSLGYPSSHEAADLPETKVQSWTGQGERRRAPFLGVSCQPVPSGSAL